MTLSVLIATIYIYTDWVYFMGIENMDRIVKKGDKKVKLLLLICNAVIIAVMLAATIFYSKRINTNQKEAKTEDFIRMVESLKQVSTNYQIGRAHV